MKKDHKISEIVKKRNDIAELLIIEQNQYMPFLKELQKQADELNTITEKIHFWENEKQKYLNGIDSYTFASSGIVSLNMPANTELFLDKEITKEINKLKALIPPQRTETEISAFTNNFDNITPTEIYEHFKAGLVEKGYLTEQELNKYLKAAFELKTKPETLFKLTHTPTKQKIYTVFYVYYKDISQKKHERQKEYAALLGDFFEGYKTEIIQTNWAREYKTKR